MNTNKVLRICGIVCILCGIIIITIVFSEGDAGIYHKITGPLQIVVGALFLLNGRHQKNN